MGFMKYLILAVLQGITEFIPISSSGHLVLFERVLGFDEPLLAFDLMLHMATTLAVIVFLRKDLSLIVNDSYLAIRSLVHKNSWAQVWQEFNYFKKAFHKNVLLDVNVQKLSFIKLFVSPIFFK